MKASAVEAVYSLAELRLMLQYLRRGKTI